MNKGKILYGLTGFLLAASTALTGNQGLSRQNQKIYEKAQSLQQKVDTLGFQGLRLEDYKVRFFNGESDYVVTSEGIQKEKPVFTTFVGTTYEVEGEYQVILPVLEDFSKMFDMLDAASGLAKGNTKMEKNGYDANEHTATLWHEAFHAYQMSHFYDNCTGRLPETQNGDNIEKIIAEDVDSQPDMEQYFEQEAELLQKAYLALDEDSRTKYLRGYLELEEQRRGQIGKDAQAAEDYYETIEGSACYIESCIISFLKGDEAMKKRYIAAFSYEKGSAKYYKIGMLKCRLLSQMDRNWNKDYTFDKSLQELLQEKYKKMQNHEQR